MFPIYLIIKVKTELGSLQSFYRPRYKKISSEQEQSKSAKQICKLIYNIITRYQLTVSSVSSSMYNIFLEDEKNVSDDKISHPMSRDVGGRGN